MEESKMKEQSLTLQNLEELTAKKFAAWSLISVDTKNLDPCNYATETAFFNIGGIVDGNNKNLSQVYTKTTSDGTFTFNFCKRAIPAPKFCVDSDSYAFMQPIIAGTRKCFDYSSSTFASDMMSGNELTGLSLKFQNSIGETGLQLNITCDAEEPSLKFVGAIENTFLYNSAMGCPVFHLRMLAQLLNRYSDPIGVFLIVSGIFISLFGNKFTDFTIGYAGFLTSSATLVNLSFSGLVNAEEWYIVSLFIISVLSSALIGINLTKARKLGLAVLAGFCGVLFGFILSSSLVISNALQFWAVITLSLAIWFYSAFKSERYTVLVGSSFVGSYLLVRGISLFTDGFPLLGSLHNQLQSGLLDKKTFPKSFYVYIAAIFICTILAFMFQRKHDIEEQKKIRALEKSI
jgi:hypothetical protein